MKPRSRTCTLSGLLLCLLLMSSLPAYAAPAAPAFDCTTVSDVPATECQALVDLYNSTNGAGWTFKTNWLTSTVGNWSGVTVSGGHVSLLSLNNNQLSGPIPSTPGNLTSLGRQPIACLLGFDSHR